MKKSDIDGIADGELARVVLASFVFGIGCVVTAVVEGICGCSDAGSERTVESDDADDCGSAASVRSGNCGLSGRTDGDEVTIGAFECALTTGACVLAAYP